MIREFDSDTRFASDAASWTISGGTIDSPAYEYCSTTLLMGGYCVLGCSDCSQVGDYFQRTYSDLPPHNSIRYVLTFWAIDSWDLDQNDHDDGFELYFDGTVVDGWYMSLYTFPYQLCGNTATYWNELPMRIFGTIPHTASTLTFRVVADLNEDSCNESFGFRDISFIFDQNEDTVGETLCATADITLPDKNCECDEGYYYTSSGCKACNSYCSSCWGSSASECYACVNSDLITYDGTECVPCYSTCATCFGGASIQCLTCISGYYYISWTRECVIYCPWPLTVGSDGATCTSPCGIDEYIAPDGTTCLSSCSSPYQTLTEHTVIKLCINPCSPVEYLYWDGSCQHDCGSPLTISSTYSNYKLCTYDCDASEYLFPDGTCGSSCDSPLVTRLTNNRYFCDSPCLTGRYLYWNGECLDSCSDYLTTSTSDGISYCNYPCDTSEYLFWNGSCLGDCPYPLQTREERLRLYCDYPTDTSEYLYWDGTSSSSCSETWLSGRVESTPNRKFCDFTCDSYSYVYWNGSCLEDCPYPLEVTVSNNIPYCEYSCSGSTYLYWNGSCLGSCDSPLTKRTEGGKDFCDYPCLTAQYLYWDGTCSFDCSGYFLTRVEGGRQFCDFPCGSSEPYLYWNGTCKGSCISPFVVSTEKEKDYCNFKCSYGQYLYSNGSCLDRCDDASEFEPWVVNSVEKYCNQASTASDEVDCTGNYYYWNNTCHDKCEAPLVQRAVGTQKWCLYPCLMGQFLYPDSRCLDTCNPPFRLREENGYKYCDYSCKSKEYAYWNGSCLSTCNSPLRRQTTPYGLSCLLPCETSDLYYHNSTGACTEECSAPAISEDDAYPICLVKPTVVSDGSFLDIFVQGSSGSPSFATIPYLLQYARFLDIQMPPRLKSLVVSKGRGIVTLRFGQYMPDDMIETYPSNPIPTAFLNRTMHAEFIVNFWSELTSWTLIALVILLLGIMESICLLVGRWKKAEAVFGKLRVLARWNLPLIMLATSVGDIVMYSILELISLGNTTAVSVELCLVMLGLLIALVFVGYNLVPIFAVSKRKIILHNSDNDYKNFLKKWENCQVLFRGFRDHVSLNGYFYLLYTFRIAFPMFIASVAYKVPIFQAGFYVAFSLLVLGYITLKKPVNRKINHIQLIVIETLVLVINFALLLLCIMNITNSQGSSAFVRLGDVVVYGSTIYNVLIVGFLIAKVAHGIMVISQNKVQDKSIWLQLLVFYLQQAGMGFEEIFVDEKAAEIFNQHQYVLEDEKRLIELERRKIQEAKKNALLNNDEQSSPTLNNSERRSTFLKRNAGNEEPDKEEKEPDEGKKGLNLKPQRIEMDSKHKLINETNFSQQSPLQTFMHADLNDQDSPGNQRIRNLVSSKFNLDS